MTREEIPTIWGVGLPPREKLTHIVRAAEILAYAVSQDGTRIIDPPEYVQRQRQIILNGLYAELGCWNKENPMTREELIREIQRKADTEGTQINAAEVSRVVAMTLDRVLDMKAGELGDLRRARPRRST